MNKPISILLVDDHTLMRKMLGDRLSSEPDMQVVATAENADGIAERMKHYDPLFRLIGASFRIHQTLKEN